MPGCDADQLLVKRDPLRFGQRLVLSQEVLGVVADEDVNSMIVCGDGVDNGIGDKPRFGTSGDPAFKEGHNGIVESLIRRATVGEAGTLWR
jgi:hypothetical protein